MGIVYLWLVRYWNLFRFYTEETAQHDSITSEQKDSLSNEDSNSDLIMPSSIYGATHLLRLFGK